MDQPPPPPPPQNSFLFPVPLPAAVLKQCLDHIPGSLLAPLVENNVIGVIIVAIAFGIALRRLRNNRDISPAARAVELFFDAIVVVLHWVIDLIPFAVFGVIA